MYRVYKVITKKVSFSPFHRLEKDFFCEYRPSIYIISISFFYWTPLVENSSPMCHDNSYLLFLIKPPVFITHWQLVLCKRFTLFLLHWFIIYLPHNKIDLIVYLFSVADVFNSLLNIFYFSEWILSKRMFDWDVNF